MRVQIRTLEILEKRFRPEDARAIAEAIEAETGPEKWVGHESLDRHFDELKLKVDLKLAETKVELIRWVVGVAGGQAVFMTGMIYFLLDHLRRG